MRVGIIRGDMPGPVFLADLEPVSQQNNPTEPRGQERYVSRPDPTSVAAALAPIPAGLLGTVAIPGALPIVIAGGGVDDTILLKTDPTALVFTTATVAAGVYATEAALIAAVNAALVAAGAAAEAAMDLTGGFLVLKSTATGPGAYIEVDSVVNGSTFDAVVGWAVGGGSFTVPTAAAVITACLPVGGPLDVSLLTLLGVIGAGPTLAQVNALCDTIAPRFIETDVAVKCYQVGYLADLLSANFNPDPSRIPALTPGPAVTVVQDDGVTLYALAAKAPVPNITNAQLGVPVPGAVTITGVGLGNSEYPGTLTVKFIDVSNLPGQKAPKLVTDYEILAAGGTVSLTSIVIPAALVPTWAVVTTTKVAVKYTSLASNEFALV